MLPHTNKFNFFKWICLNLSGYFKAKKKKNPVINQGIVNVIKCKIFITLFKENECRMRKNV